MKIHNKMEINKFKIQKIKLEDYLNLKYLQELKANKIQVVKIIKTKQQ